MSNITLATTARNALGDPDFEDADGYCQRFVRQCLEAVYGDKYADYMKSSAKLAAQAFLSNGLGTQNFRVLEVGDILYKTKGSGGFGHVGIYLGDGKGVAENSSTPIGRVQGAKGIRTLRQFGGYQVMVRLPDPNVRPVAKRLVELPVEKLPAKLVIVRNGERHLVSSSVLVNGRFACGAVELLDLAGVTVVKQVNRLGEPQPRVDLYLD